ncbi:MAG: extensin family protein [Hyphomicrobiaceae bacterium]|nr:extensin family protein [Hyphomicrobiaceae bacterium]
MWRSCVIGALLVVGALLAWGCSRTPEFIARHEPWRAEEEQACLASGAVQSSPFLHARAALGGPSVCGALQPFEMAAVSGGRVQMRPAAMLRCPMVPVLERWVRDVVEPAARRHFGAPMAELKVAASYSCRPMNHQSGARLSEHGHANALDVSAFLLADGRRIDVKSGWWGDARERAFLRTVHDGACGEFTTVLGPDYDSLHRDHFHLDLARREYGNRRVCK